MSALTAHKQGDLEQAMEGYKRVLSVDSKNADALHLSGLVTYQKQNLDEAHKLVSRAIKLNAQAPVFWNTLGLIERALGNSTVAIKNYQRAVELEPRFADAWSNMGTAWHNQGESEKAENCYKKALEINPRQVNALVNLGQILNEKQLCVEAATLFEAALEINPQNNEALAMLASTNQTLCRWDDIPAQHERINQLVESGVAAFIQPFTYLSMTTSPEAQLHCAEAWSRRVMSPFERLAKPRESALLKNENEKIRVAYWSSDFQEHATSYLLADVIECHTRENFEIILLSYGRDNGGSMRGRLTAAADDFIDVRKNSYEEVVSLIRELGIDILVNLNGYNMGARTPMLALRPAPVQVNWLGYAETLGTAHADYILADDYIIPLGMERFYAEKVVRLSMCYQPNDRKRTIGEAMTRQDCGLPESGIVFCFFNQAYKILPQMFDVWMRILMRVPGSVLWLLSAGTEMENNLRSEAKRRDIAPERVLFAERLPLAQHLARYRIADVALDTFPYGSHTTASDAIWAGCPLIALVGDTFASRVSGSVLRAAGLPELITEDFKSFEELAVRLAHEPQALLALRQRIASTRDTMPLFDTPAFTRSLESAFRDMLVGR